MTNQKKVHILDYGQATHEAIASGVLFFSFPLLFNKGCLIAGCLQSGVFNLTQGGRENRTPDTIHEWDILYFDPIKVRIEIENKSLIPTKKHKKVNHKPIHLNFPSARTGCNWILKSW